MSGTTSATTGEPCHRLSAGANATIVGCCVIATSLLLPPNPISQVAGIAGMVLLIGAVLTSSLDLRGTSLAARLAVALGFGVVAFLLVGALLGAVLTHVGVARPLSRDPLLVAWGVILVAIAARTVVTRADPVRSLLDGVSTRHLAWALVLAAPPLGALVGVALLNSKSDATLAIVVGVLAMVMAVAAVAVPDAAPGPPRVLLLASAMLTVALQGTFRGGWLAGFDIQHEFYIGSLAIQQGRFPLTHYVDPYGGMLSLTVWPAQLHALTGATLRGILGVAPSIFLSTCVLVTWCILRERLGGRASAALCAIFILGSEPLVQELPQVTRQCYALFFFSLLVLAISSTSLPRRSAQALACASGVGIAVTHYSSAYLAAGAVLLACAATYAARTPRDVRVLTWPVTSVVVGAAVLWGGLVARTGSSISQVLSSVRSDGLGLLPGTGGVVERWLRGASISQLVNAKVIYAADLKARHTTYKWMSVTSAADHLRLVNDPAPTAHGVRIVGPLLSVGGTTLAQLVLLGSVAAVLWCCWWSRRHPRTAALSGAAVFFVIAAGLSRFSQTVGVDFGPSRVAAQAFLIFVVAVGVAISTEPVRRPLARLLASGRTHAVVLVIAVVAVGGAVATSTGLAAMAIHKGQLPMAYSATGEQAQRLLSADDVGAASWVAVNRPSRYVVQADRIGSLALDDFGFNDRRNFFSSVDPIIVDNGSWVLAYRTNVVLGSARGGNNARTGVFVFPASYFGATRSILYVSPTDVVYGPTRPAPADRAGS